MAVYYESRKNKRHQNQDYCFCMEYRVNQEAMIRNFIVADGMGGLSLGELASRMAVEKWVLKLSKFTMSDKFLNHSVAEQIEGLKLFSYGAVREINEEIYQELNDQGVSGGTTLTVCILFYHTLIMIHCGDSPVYYYNDENRSLIKISRDQNVAEELVRQGKIEKNSVEYFHKKNKLTDYLGKYRKPEPQIKILPFLQGDVLLLGSDGAFGALSEEQMKLIVENQKAEPEQIMKMVLDEALKTGEEDNQTLIVYCEEKIPAISPEPKRGFGLFRKRQVV